MLYKRIFLAHTGKIVNPIWLLNKYIFLNKEKRARKWNKGIYSKKRIYFYHLPLHITANVRGQKHFILHGLLQGAGHRAAGQKQPMKAKYLNSYHLFYLLKKKNNWGEQDSGSNPFIALWEVNEISYPVQCTPKTSYFWWLKCLPVAAETPENHLKSQIASLFPNNVLWKNLTNGNTTVSFWAQLPSIRKLKYFNSCIHFWNIFTSLHGKEVAFALREEETLLRGEMLELTQHRGQDTEAVGHWPCLSMALWSLPGTPSSTREVRGGARAWLTAAAATGTRVEKV